MAIVEEAVPVEAGREFVEVDAAWPKPAFMPKLPTDLAGSIGKTAPGPS